jgi:hypothetical protein
LGWKCPAELFLPEESFDSKLIGNLYFILLNPMLHLELETTNGTQF